MPIPTMMRCDVFFRRFGECSIIKVIIADPNIDRSAVNLGTIARAMLFGGGPIVQASCFVFACVRRENTAGTNPMRACSN
eukprot:3782697-Ditylum_brightwellii.AAC.1